MQRRAPTAGCGFVVWLLVAQAGCSPFGLRRDNGGTPTPQEAARAQAISERAQQAMDRGNYEEARVDLLDLVAHMPQSPEAQQRLGTLLQLEGRLPEAEECFQAALKYDPDYVDALIGLGQVKALRGDSLAAAKHFETAIEINPHRSKAHYSLGHLLEAMGQSDEALAEYFLAIEFEPNNPAVNLRIAAIQLARNQPDQALSRLDQVVELVPENPEARALRGRTHLTLRHFRDAVDDLRLATARRPDPEAFYQLALALEADHKPADALRAAEGALQLAPDFASARDLTQRLALAPQPPARPRMRGAGESTPPAEPAR